MMNGAAFRAGLGRVFGVGIVWLAAATPCAFAQGEIDEQATAGYALRVALGYDAITLAVLDVPTVTYDTIALSAILHAQNNLEALTPVLAQWYEARFGLGDPTAADNTEDAITAVTDAYAAVLHNLADVETNFVELLDDDGQAGHAHAVDNAGLDPLLRLLLLSQQQRADLWSATLARDAIVRNPYKWHRTSLCAAARAAFADEVEQILTDEQLGQLGTYESLVEENLEWAMERDQIAYETASQYASAARFAPYLALVFVSLEPAFPTLGLRIYQAVGSAMAGLAQAPAPARKPKGEAVSMRVGPTREWER